MPGYTATQIEILRFLLKEFEEGKRSSYLYRIAKKTKRPMTTVLDSLRDLKKKGLVKVKAAKPQKVREPTRFYQLTGKGRALAWAFLRSDKLMSLYISEEINDLGKNLSLVRHMLMEMGRRLQKIQSNQILELEKLGSVIRKIRLAWDHEIFPSPLLTGEHGTPL